MQAAMQATMQAAMQAAMQATMHAAMPVPVLSCILCLLLQYYWGDGNYIGGLNPRQANPYIHVSDPAAGSPKHLTSAAAGADWHGALA
jgi:hypothetical protein